MDIVLKKVSVSSLILLKLSVECSIHHLEKEVSDMEHECNSFSSKFGLRFHLDNLKDKKADLVAMRNLYNQL